MRPRRPPTLAKLNRTLRAGERRAEALEPHLESLLAPILETAGDRASRAFAALATHHLTAAAARRADLEVLARLGAEEVRRIMPTLTAAALDPRSTMICVKPRPAEAAALVDPDGEPADTLHVTLCYLGEVDGDLEPIAAALRGVAATHAPLSGIVAGYGQFGTPDPDAPPVGILLPDVPGLVELRVAVTEALHDAGVDYARNHGFEAHVTVDYDPEPDELEEMLGRYGAPLHFDELLVVRGDVEVVPIPLVGAPPVTAAGSPPTPPDWTAPAGAEVLDVDALVALLRTKTDPVRLAVIETMMEGALADVGVDFDVTNPFTARVLEQSGSQIVDIAQTTQVNVMRIVAAAYEQGLSIPDTAKAIRVGMSEAAPMRARLIARTELVGAVNGGSLAATQIVQSATGDTYSKTWMTAGGARHPRHETYTGLDGQTVPLDGYFDVGGASLMHPGDPDGPADEICNCRCTMSYTGSGGDEIDAEDG